jgi:fatty acid desaturase
VITVGLVALALGFVILDADTGLRWACAVLLAVAFGRVGHMMHDIGHGQVFETRRPNAIAGVFFGNLLLGISTEWWQTNHNRHHDRPNQVGFDPDISYPVIAFTEDQAHGSAGLARWIVTHQMYLLPAAMGLIPLSMRKDSLRFVRNGLSMAPRRESISLALHYAWFVGGAVWLFGTVDALLLLMLNQFAFGIVLASMFAPNHKGMPMIGKDQKLGFLERQLLTSRNVSGGRFVGLWYGGLNCQIEHHLFPSMPCNNLPKAREITRAFCREHGLPYVETSSMESYRQALRYMHAVGEPMRASR